MSDFAIKFENVVGHFLGHPVTTIYYANYFEFDFPRRALLFSICVKEINVNPGEYTNEELAYLSDVQDLIKNGKESYDDQVKLIDFFYNRRAT
jgi:hypothetical protein